MNRPAPGGTEAASMRAWMVPLVVTALAVGGSVTVVPMGDGSYDCLRSPISFVLDPAPERAPGPEFFDDGAACNRDARERVQVAVGVALGGLALTAAVALAPRLAMRPGRPIRPLPAGAAPPPPSSDRSPGA